MLRTKPGDARIDCRRRRLAARAVTITIRPPDQHIYRVIPEYADILVTGAVIDDSCMLASRNIDGDTHMSAVLMPCTAQMTVAKTEHHSAGKDS
jgi:hypothetical protein